MKTYCNPLPLPDYPIGIYARRGLPDGWLNNEIPCSFRETADPSVIFEDGKWYLYASCGKMWFSDETDKKYHKFTIDQILLSIDFIFTERCKFAHGDSSYSGTINELIDNFTKARAWLYELDSIVNNIKFKG